MSFRIIPTQKREVYMNMALDEACMQSVRDGGSPTIRLYECEQPSITIGRYQCLADEIRVQAVKEDKIPITRRITGGGVMLHDKHISYSVVAPQDFFVNDVRKSFGQIIKPLMKALAALGVETHFHPLSDVVLDKKIIGNNAQTRKEGVLLQHGTISVDLDEDKIRRYLAAEINIHATSYTDLTSTSLSYQEIHDAIRNQLRATFKAQEKNWTGDELEQARELAERYKDESWIALR